jgi:hypothetical protein
MSEENFVERLRQPLNNIGLAGANLGEHFGQQGSTDPVVSRALETIARNVKRLDAELVEIFKNQPPVPEDYWGEDGEYLLESWRYEIANNDTRLGYWEWVEGQRDLGA